MKKISIAFYCVMLFVGAVRAQDVNSFVREVKQGVAAFLEQHKSNVHSSELLNIFEQHLANGIRSWVSEKEFFWGVMEDAWFNQADLFSSTQATEPMKRYTKERINPSEMLKDPRNQEVLIKHMRQQIVTSLGDARHYVGKMIEGHWYLKGHPRQRDYIQKQMEIIGDQLWGQDMEGNLVSRYPLREARSSLSNDDTQKRWNSAVRNSIWDFVRKVL